MHALGLLRERRFAPFFWTQFLGAFNDNVYKNALIILIAYQLGAQAGSAGHGMINAAAGLFILPFFLFSATAGQLADRMEKARLIRAVKLAEIVIMLGAALCLFWGSPWSLIAVLFLMGAQSSVFGPVKYAILPQHLHREELVGGNGLVEMGTFLAILLGTLLGGLLIAWGDSGPQLVAVAVVLLALLGYAVSRGIPEAPPAAGGALPLRWNIAVATWQTLRDLAADRVQLLCALAISWFWFYGATLLTQIPNFTRLHLYGDERVVTLLLTTFSVGIGMGSLLVESLSRRRIVLWLSLLGGLGMALFGLALYPLVMAVPAAESLRSAGAFLAAGGWEVLAGVLLLGLCGGWYIVPLFALIQRRAPADRRSRVIAGVNILNALFMVASAIFAGSLLGKGVSIPLLFVWVAVLDLLLLLVLLPLLARNFGGWGAVPESELT